MHHGPRNPLIKSNLDFLPTNWLVPPVTQLFYLPGSVYEQFYCGLPIWYQSTETRILFKVVRRKKKKDLIIAISKYLNHILKALTSWRNYSLHYSNNAKIIMKHWHLRKQFYLYRPQGKTQFKNTSNFMTPKPKY